MPVSGEGGGELAACGEAAEFSSFVLVFFLSYDLGSFCISQGYFCLPVVEPFCS